VQRVHFHVQKGDERQTFEQALQDSPSPTKVITSKRPKQAAIYFNTVHLSPRDYEQAGKAAPGWDIASLEREWREWIERKGKEPDKPGSAFVAFCRKKRRLVTV
jgi:hypothetical protein